MGSYEKIHLFSVMEENRVLEPGSSIVSFDTPWGRMGLAICFDLRFPELFRALMLDGVHTVILPAFWPAPRLDHWRLLIRARALENQFNLIACNCAGEKGGLELGYSAVIGPDGQPLAEAGLREILLEADLDLKRVAKVRKKFPVLTERRETLYPSLNRKFNYKE
jgi:predicted amidohydrolase